MFVMATTITGEAFISEFDRLRGIRQLAADVMSGRKPFPVWEIVATVHEVSGERVNSKTRRFLNGSQIATLQVVHTDVDDHRYDPSKFRPVRRVDAGSAGVMQFTPETVPNADVFVGTGIDYPIHRAPDGRRFVVLLDGVTAIDERVEHYIDAEPAVTDIVSAMSSPSEWDDEENL